MYQSSRNIHSFYILSGLSELKNFLRLETVFIGDITGILQLQILLVKFLDLLAGFFDQIGIDDRGRWNRNGGNLKIGNHHFDINFKTYLSSL